MSSADEHRHRYPPQRWRRFLRAWWSELTTVGPYNGAHWGAVQVGVAVVVPLVVMVGTGRTDLAGYAVFGSLSSVYGRRNPHRDRLRTQLQSATALTVAVATGVLVGVADSAWVSVGAMAVMAILGAALGHRYGWLPVPSLFLVLATGTVSSVPHTWTELPVAIGLTALAGLFGAAVGQLGASLQPRGSLVPAPPVRRLRDADTRALGLELATYGLAPLLAGSIAVGLGIGHPYWAAVSATVPVAGRGLPSQLARATMRLAGTMVGIVIAYLLLAGDPALWVLIAAVAVFQIVTELFVSRHYGLAVICITPMALILGQLVVHHPLDQLVTDRIVETVIGIGGATAVLVPTRALRRTPTH